MKARLHHLYLSKLYIVKLRQGVATFNLWNPVGWALLIAIALMFGCFMFIAGVFKYIKDTIKQ